MDASSEKKVIAQRLRVGSHIKAPLRCPGIDRLMKLGLVVLLLSHLAACFWGLLGRRKGRGVSDFECRTGIAVPYRRCSWMQIASASASCAVPPE